MLAQLNDGTFVSPDTKRIGEHQAHMSSLIHHLETLSWAWVAQFAAVDAIAIGSAVVAATGRNRRRAFWALLVAVCATHGPKASGARQP